MLPENVLRAAGRIGELESAFDAELLLSTLLGGVYQALAPDRGPAFDAFLDTLSEYLAASAEPSAPQVAAVLDGGSPAARPTGGYAFGDRYGDQTSYVATFRYDDPERGGPEHAVVVLADHNLGMATDVLVLAPAAPVLERLRDSTLTDPDAMTWLVEVPLATVRKAAHAYLRATDLAGELPEGESLRANRFIARARLALLPDSPDGTDPTDETDPADPTDVTDVTGAATATAAASGTESADGSGPPDHPPAADQAPPSQQVPAWDAVSTFLASPEATLAGVASDQGPRGESARYCLGLISGFANDRGADPLRWSPRAVDTFLTEWVHRRAVLDSVDAAMLPDALAAWVLWAGRRLDLPDHAIQTTFHRVNAQREEFARLCATGERRSPAAVAMARLVAEGVDLTDEAAVDAWLRAYNAEHG